MQLRGPRVALAWRTRFGKAKGPICAPTAGFLAGALTAALGRRHEVQEVSCAAYNALACRFRVVAGEPVPEPEWARPAAAPPAPPARGDGAWTPPPADEEGRIGWMGELFTALPAEFYLQSSRRYEREVPRQLGEKFGNLPPLVLVESGHRSTYHALGEMTRSEHWRSEVRPSLHSREDWLDALLALPEGLGWGRWRIQAFQPGESLTLRVDDSYEGAGYLSRWGPAATPKCYHARGAAAALMNLLYVGDLRDEPTLSASHYNALFRSPVSFRAVETRCRALDDPFCELVVNPLSTGIPGRLRRLLG